MQIISESGEMNFNWYWWDLIFVISIIIIKKNRQTIIDGKEKKRVRKQV